MTFCFTSVIVAGWRPPVVVSVPLLVMPMVSLMMSVSIISSTPAAAVTETEAWPRGFPVVEVNAWGGTVSRVGDGEVDTYLKARDFRSIHGVSCLLRILHLLKINEGKATRPLGWSVQHNLDLLDLPVTSELSVQVRLGGREVQSEDSEALGGCRVLPVPVHLGRSGEAGPGP